ncbi:MAG: hypothetical protein BGO32_00025 [Bacteroidetes bacterium 37-13]|nr:MAG: hypothetical protein BGO32_00025 [Bacteroidetes bacterium 37-13]
MIKHLHIIFFLFLAACNSGGSNPENADRISCGHIPENFSSYHEAISVIEKSDFKYSDDVNTTRSSWIRGARFYSCSGNEGYFIIETDNGIYIHKNMPVHVWNAFKTADSFGRFYNAYIKNNYQLLLN